MDGLGHVTLRNRKFLRKIEPMFRRHVTFDSAFEKTFDGPDKNNSSILPDQSLSGSQLNEFVNPNKSLEVRKSDRIRKPPDRYEAKW